MIKKDTKMIILLLLFVSLPVVILGTNNFKLGEKVEQSEMIGQTVTAPFSQRSFSTEEYEYPHISLSEELNYFVPRNISVRITAFSSSPGVIIRCDILDFKMNITWKLNEYSQPYFVNQKVFFNASILELEQQYNLTLLVFDNLGRNSSITRTVEIDPILPVILDLNILENRIYYGETIQINYQVEEDHLRGVYFLCEGRDGYLTVNHRLEGTLNIEYYFFDLPGGYTQYEFACKVMVLDFAGNNINESFTLLYIDDRREGLSRDEQNELILKVLKTASFVLLVDIGFLIGVIVFVSNLLEKKGV